MEIEYQLSKKNYIEFTKLYVKDNLQRRRLVIFLFIFILIFPLAGETFIWWRFLLAIIVSPLFAFGISYFIPLWIGMSRLNKAIAIDGSLLEKKLLSIRDDGIKIASESKTDIWKWESMAAIYSNKEFLYIIRADKKVIPIPQRAFPVESETTNFLGLIQSNIFKIRGASKYQISSSYKKPSYYIGILCLIPVIGAITGLVLIINGIAKYKDKWFVVMGAGGIISTIVFWSTLFYTDTFGFQSTLAKISQKQLNNLMAQVEIYKIKNGDYPDSLAQLETNNTIMMIYDPLKPGGKATKSDEYNYQKVGNHYYLFSSGIDRIPGNADDIYPEVSKSDSGKFGLIRK